MSNKMSMKECISTYFTNGNNLIFTCKQGMMISSYFVCDEQFHCNDRDDEEFYLGGTNFITPTRFCNHYTWLKQNLSKLCPDYKMTFQNQNISCARSPMETLTLSLKRNISAEQNAIAHFASFCIFELDDCGQITVHQNGQHLIECEEASCSAEYFKCPGFYCIPLRYVCNGVWECPGGMEELPNMNCHLRICSGLFKCSDSVICIASESICDGIIDCPHGDDIRFCDMNLAVCPRSCTCLLYIKLKCIAGWEQPGIELTTL